MAIQRIEDGDRGVSPVIGVTLMVAITVLLAATSATFFFGVGDESLNDRAPTVVMDHDFARDSGSYVLKVRHTGGDTADPGTIRFMVAGAACSAGGDPNGRFAPADLDNTDSRISAGSRFTLSKSTLCGPGGGDLDLSTAAISVDWIGVDGGRSYTLWGWKGPNA